MGQVGIIRYAVFIVTAISLSACSTSPTSSQERTNTSAVDAANQKIAALSKAQLDACMGQEFERLRVLSPCKVDDISFAQLANNKKISSQERELFILASTKLDEYGKQITQAYRDAHVESANKIADARAWAHTQSLQNRLALVNREITWGEYLKQRMNIEASMLRRAQ